MDMTGEYRIPAPREKVWEGLNDPEILKQCIPGCESLDKVSDTEFTARVAAKVGPVSAKFGGKVQLSDINPPESYKISGEGTGGAAGFAKGGATVNLAEDGSDTVLTYHANAQVGGKLAQIGSRLIDATAKKMADQFFGRFAEVVGEPAPAAAPEAAPPPPPEVPAEPASPEPAPVEPAPATGIPAEPPPPREAPSGPAPAPSKGLPPAVWIGGLVALVIIILLILT